MIWISIVYGGRHVSKFDWNLNSAPLLFILFCRVVNMARWCSNLVTGWWKVVSMTLVALIFLTSVCGMNNYESCSKRTDKYYFFNSTVPSTDKNRDSWELSGCHWHVWTSKVETSAKLPNSSERGLGTKRPPFCSDTFQNWNVTVASALRVETMTWKGKM
jgi:hypothetical protein